jgi:hypothetical protein
MMVLASPGFGMENLLLRLGPRPPMLSPVRMLTHVHK